MRTLEKLQEIARAATPIPGFDGYFIFKDGRIYSAKRRIFLKPALVNGYWGVGLYLSKSKKATRVSIHRLLMIAFKPTKNYGKLQVDHINGIKTDNRLSNLRWCTSKENIGYSHAMGLSPRGERHPKAKITRKQVEWARKRFVWGCKINGYSALARKLGIDRTTMRDAIGGVSWN